MECDFSIAHHTKEVLEEKLQDGASKEAEDYFKST
jgi:hypothetical protein